MILHHAARPRAHILLLLLLKRRAADVGGALRTNVDYIILIICCVRRYVVARERSNDVRTDENDTRVSINVFETPRRKR